ncbi:unnamed protein product [Rotaria magnacalcarata]|uniref:Uncharacterized protein n=1 Tax=Rotaria magnacalcarata TaxID=392030 RepID=A0A816R340_9BILA|nr:unnamed protein product [Rotaria magnacalcarata]CAF1667531.1 unnamed protein product [Rotaria magnacalcarata]CAF2066588.1 unnamed protein product [Rotaria magnacalcarata]CAF2067542.1 unnamed protein product [Rotaria magnacalcarata]CAF2104369.1 unnamed protein product [Rotaria magnacalcarata]
MTTTGSIDEWRGDSRCGICRQKGIFKCEHDTPYRDLYLGVFDPKTPRNMLINDEKTKNSNGAHNEKAKNSHGVHNEKAKNSHGTQNNSASNGGVNAGRPANLNADGQLHHGKKSRKPVATKTQPANTSEHNKNKKKGCTIL